MNKEALEKATKINEINPFHATALFLYPLKTSENVWLMSAGNIKRNRWHEWANWSQPMKNRITFFR